VREDRPARESGDRAAVARRLLGEVIRGPDAAGARHHLHGHVRLAGDVAADMAAHQPGIEVDAAAGGAGDVDRHRPIDGVLRVGWLRRDERCDAS
jgi:hypothetical protein